MSAWLAPRLGLWLGLAALHPATASPPPAPPREAGERQLQQGRYRLAARWYRQQLQARPGDTALQVGLGRALAAFGRCTEATRALQAGQLDPRWDAAAAVDLARCQAALGAHSQALATLDEALLLAAEPAAVQLERVLQALEAGDLPTALAATEALLTQPDANAAVALAQASLALHQGDETTLDRALRDLRGTGEDRPRADLLAALRWLELDAPAEALALLEPARWRRRPLPALDLWRAEALRRLGQPLEALALLDAPGHVADESLLRAALRLRVEADLLPAGPPSRGAELLAQAHTLLARDPMAPELVATAWYVARRTGLDGTVLAQRYQRVAWPGRARLDVLVPPEQRQPPGEARTEQPKPSRSPGG